MSVIPDSDIDTYLKEQKVIKAEHIEPKYINSRFKEDEDVSRDNLNYINQIGGTAYIPFKENSIAKSGGSPIWRKMYFYFKMNQTEFMQNYNKRSNIESTFSAMKKKLGETLKSKNHTAQVNELLCKVIAYNIMVLIQEMHELGIEPTFLKGR